MNFAKILINTAALDNNIVKLEKSCVNMLIEQCEIKYNYEC